MKPFSEVVLGLDTSNYTSSVAVVTREGTILADERIPLQVKQGERGLRQSDALFQHMENLPILIERAFEKFNGHNLAGVSASNRPRPIEGSYMPVFRSGVAFARAVCAAKSVPLFLFSHQEGHLSAARMEYESFDDQQDYLAFHLSGGTCELLQITDQDSRLLGRSLDLSFGQVLDRVGVAIGYRFPAGEQMDQVAENQEPINIPLTKPKRKGLDLNLSGLETQGIRLWETGNYTPSQLAFGVMSSMAEAIIEWTYDASMQSGCKQVLYSGGVAASRFLRNEIQQAFADTSIIPIFGRPALSSDNGVGIAWLGRKLLWQSNR